ncbi:hypothetical protein GS836_06290 [Rhodococcus hoagii]|nr:hypothetical protein [Prescottella equi]
MTVPTHDRLAIVTGADSGMGRATAQLLASDGYDVGITFHTDEAGLRTPAPPSSSADDAATSPARI